MLSIKEITLDHQREPQCLASSNPAISWVLESDQRDVLQKSYRIELQSGEKPIWDSGVIFCSESNAVPYTGPDLKEETPYQIKLSVTDNKEDTAVRDLCFHTGYFSPLALRGHWITHTMEDKGAPCPIFVKSFSAEGAKEIKEARLSVSALGIYNAKLNGEPVSENYFAPGWTDYKTRVQFQTYDVTHLIKNENTLEITAANGWFAGCLNGADHIYGKKTAVWALLRLIDLHGKETVIMTDESWQWKLGTVRYAEFYHGEVIDHTAPATEPLPIEIVKKDLSCLVQQQAEPVCIIQTLSPKLLRTPAGKAILDFGQNMTGIVELAVDGNPDQKITLRYGEMLDQNGELYTKNLRTARSEDVFICAGGHEVFSPQFTFHGFRYAEVNGMGTNFEPTAFRGLVLSTNSEITAEFSCSDVMVNRLWENILWGQLGNSVDIPTDCPQRDERLGWTGDAAVFCRTAMQNRDCFLFFKKWLEDLAAEQNADGSIPHVIPNVNGFGSGGAAVWCDASTIVPWTMYEIYGDKRILEQQYSSMKAWVEYLKSQETQDHLRQGGFQYGDWLALDREEGAGNKGSSDKYLIATALYAYSTLLTARSAEVLGKTGEAKDYYSLYESICDGFQHEYITETGRLVSETQTDCALVLLMDLANPDHRDRILKTLINNLAEHQNHLTTGFVGTPLLMNALTESGRHDIAGKLLLNRDFPGWLYEVKMGATTVWERWDSIRSDGSFDDSGMNSFNHCAFGAVGQWIIEQLAGIQLIQPGYARSRLRPQFAEGITFVNMCRTTPYGKLVCNWKCEKGVISVDVKIPVNTTAIIYRLSGICRRNWVAADIILNI